MRTFTWRLTLWFSALVTGTAVALLLVGGWLLHAQLIHSIEYLHDVEGEELLALIGSSPVLTPTEIARRVQEEADSDAALFYLQVHHERGELLFQSENLGGAILPSPPEERAHWTANVPGLGPLRISEYRRGPWHLQVASRLDPVTHVLRDYARVSSLLAAVAALASVGLGYGFSRFTLRPVRAIEQTARRIRGDNLGERIPVPAGKDELASLSRLLNQMFDRLQAAFAQVQRFTADASHELKTPLALIRLNAEKLRPRLAGDPEAVVVLEDLCEEITRLHQIIESLLFLSKVEGGGLSVAQHRFDLAPWVQDFAVDAAALAEDRGLRFELGRNEPGQIRGEPHLLRHLLLNLITNALNAVPPGGGVKLESYARDEERCWTVTDDGPGLPEDQLDRIFHRFVRLEGTGAGGRGGQGLGLAIVRSIATLHGGAVNAENRTDRPGLRIIVRLPRAGASAPVAEQLAY